MCSEESRPRLRVQVRGRLYDILWGLGPRNMGSRAQALYQGPNSHIIPPFDSCPVTENESRTIKRWKWSPENLNRRFANCLTVHEPTPCVWDLPWGIRKVFPAYFSLNALVPINTSFLFPTPLFTFSPLKFSLCQAPSLSVVFLSVHFLAQIIHPLEPSVSPLNSSLSFQFSFTLLV